MIGRGLLLLIAFVLVSFSVQATEKEKFVSSHHESSYFPLINENGFPVAVFLENTNDKGVQRVAANLRNDFQKVTDNIPSSEKEKRSIIIGTVGKSEIIDKLISEGQIEAKSIVGKNEKYILTTLKNPTEGVDEAVVIAGSDKRGTIYGVYELSSQIGVSPWYYWADVPVEKQTNLFVKPGIYTEEEPAVEYRGIFLNDEAPALNGWARVTFGGFNHKFYEKVFELILRLKGNFLWPAMWGQMFYDEDPLNGILADEYGVVISTSHHEPMGRAHAEWNRYGKGAWDYEKNPKVLQDFWRQGMDRMKNWESVVTIGMRGDGDEAMGEATNIKLLEKIVKDQRRIISDVTGRKASETPQVWALYKEVQDYYDKGMRVPDDVTLLLCDDNWGNVRKLPELNKPQHKGGFGMYYHFDYVGGPRNYKWINVTQIQRVWEQMNLAYEHGVDKIWVVNVGDLKPMEFPISFFLDMAWNPKQFNANNLQEYTEDWCAQQFGEKYAKESARLLDLYTKYNARVTPELLNEKTYSLENYNEFERVVIDYRNLLIDAMRVYNSIPNNYKDAFDQLVLFPINACSNLYDMYYALAKNKYYASRNDIQANYWADQVKACFERDSLFTKHYNEDISGGKWKHMMDQVRIGYTSWQQPDHSTMPEVEYIMQTMQYKEKIFVESDGYVSIEAPNFSRESTVDPLYWQVIPNLGKTLSAVTSMPVTESPDRKEMFLEYDIELQSTGEIELIVLLSPSLNFNSNKGLRYAVSIDGGEEHVVNINKNFTVEQMEHWQATSINRTITKHRIERSGKHTIRFRALDTGIVLQKIIIDAGGLKDSYLGAPESQYIR